MEKLMEVGSERAVLAGILNYGNKAFIEVDELISSKTFTQDANQIIYKCLKNFFETSSGEDKPDIASIYASAKAIGNDGFFDNADEKKHLRSLFNFPVNFESIRKLSIRLKKLEIARELHAEVLLAQQELVNITGDESITQIISIVENPLLDFGTRVGIGSDEDVSHIGDGLDEFFDYLVNNPRESVGIASGFPMYDKCIGGGFRRGSVNIIGARPKIGKTTLGINMSLNVAGGLDIPVIYFDMEMDKQDFWVKMISNISGVKVDTIESGKFSEDELELAKHAKDAIKNLNIHYVNICGKSFEETLALAKRTVMKHVGKDDNGKVKDCLMIYDYFRLNNSESISNNIQEYQALGFQIVALKIFAKKLDIPILSFIQLNRDGIDKEDTDVASGSDRIIWLCNNFTIFKPKGEEENENEESFVNSRNDRKLVPIVARHGGGLGYGDYINVLFDGSLARIKEGRTRSQEYKQNVGLGRMDDGNNTTKF